MLNRLLEKQISKFLSPSELISPAVKKLLDVISETYDQNDRDRKMLEHSMDISSAEMIELNNELKIDNNKRKETELKNTLLIAELKKSEAKFRSLFEDSRDPMLLLDDNYKFIDCNGATLKMMCAKYKSDLIYKSPEDISPTFQPDGQLSAQKLNALYTEALKNNSALFEWTHIRLDGMNIILEISFTRIPSPTSSLYLVRWTDLTERRKFENLLKVEAQHQLLVKFSENVPGAIYQVQLSANGSITCPFVSAGIRGILELNVQEFKDNPMLAFQRIHPMDHRNIQVTFATANRNLSIWEYNCRVLLPGKGLRWINGSARPEKMPDNTVVWNGYVNDITDKKEAENLLKENEAQFRDILNNTDELVQNVRLEDGKLLYVNPAWLKNLEYTEEESRNIRFQDIVHPESLSHCMELFQTVSQGKTIDRIEAIFVSKTGKKIFVEGHTGCFIKDEKPYSTRGLFRNVTETRRAAEQINRERELSNTIMNNLPGIFYLFDSTGKFLRWNKNFEIITGYSGEEIASMLPPDFYGAEDAEKLARRYREGTNNSLTGIEFNLLTKEKKPVPIFLNSLGINYEGRLCRLGMGINISERKKAEELLLHNQIRFEEAQELAHIGSWEFNFFTYEVNWSKEMYRVFEMEETPPDQLYSEYRKRLHPEDLPKFDNAVQAVIDRGEVYSVECRLLTANGSIKYVHAIGEPLKSTIHHKVIGLRGTVQDITGIKLAEQMLQASKAALDKQQQLLIQTNMALEEKARLLLENNRNLQEAHIALDKKAEELATTSRYKSEFLANMSHELRTPLNSIMILSKLLQKNKGENLTSKQVEFAEVIQKSGADLLHLINEVLDLAKIESGKIELDLSENSLSSFVRDIELSFKGIAIEREIKFMVKLDKSIPEMVKTDFGKLGQILKNLLSNAFKFTLSNGKVQLRIRKKPVSKTATKKSCMSQDLLEFVVKDDGIGIPVDKQELVFLAFQQADGTTQRKYGGTGLGLSISRELARLLGGEIILKSKEGAGATFILTIPILSKNTDTESA